MGDQSVTRKLAAILYADVDGYSRLTGADEEGTHKTLGEHLDVVTTSIENHRGRVVHFAGDAGPGRIRQRRRCRHLRY